MGKVEDLIRDLQEEFYAILRHADIEGYEGNKKLDLVKENLTTLAEFFVIMKAFVMPHRHIIDEEEFDREKVQQMMDSLLPADYKVKIRDDYDLEDIKMSLRFLVGVYESMGN